MSGSKSSQTPTMGGLEALVAAANAANQPGNHAQKKRKREEEEVMIDPALQNNGDTGSNDALMSLFANPAFLNALAATMQSPMPDSTTQQQPSSFGYDSSEFTSLQQQPLSAPTPFQQTRSGRISRPPAQPLPQYNLLQSVAAEADSPNFDNVLKTLSQAKEPVHVQEAVAAKPKRKSRYDLEATGLAAFANPPATQHETNGRHWSDQTLAGMGGEQYPISEDEAADSPDGLPRWPLPPSGAGGRKAMTREEISVRRRERNRVAASEARKRKRDYFDAMESRLYKQEEAYGLLQTHCRNLEQHIQQLERVVKDAGLPLPHITSAPNSLVATGLLVHRPAPTPASVPAPPVIDRMPSLPPMPDMSDTPATFASFEESPLPPFDMFFNVDMDGDDDGEFLPPSSPPEASDAEDKGKKGKGKKRQEDDDDDDDFEDDDVEDEDLFLPIEDVPVPPAAQMESAMRSLGVDNQEQLASLINKMVQSGKEGMTSEMMGKLKVLLSLVGPNGSWKR